MTYRVQIESVAFDDIERVAAWYDRQRPGLGGQFVGEVDRVIDRLTRFPEAYAVVYRSVRKVRVGRFTYFLTYVVFVGEVVVLGVFAEAQHPARPQPRIDPA